VAQSVYIVFFHYSSHFTVIYLLQAFRLPVLFLHLDVVHARHKDYGSADSSGRTDNFSDISSMNVMHASWRYDNRGRKKKRKMVFPL
jgi:hypothetical protein